MTKKEQMPTSLVESLVRAMLDANVPNANVPNANGPRAPVAEPRPKASSGDIIDRRDERGVGYPGDFPNPSGSGYRGCF